MATKIVELYRLNDFHETLQKSYFDAAKWYFKKYGNEAVKVTKVRTGEVRVIRRKTLAVSGGKSPVV